MHVAAGAEIAAGARDDDRFDIVHMLQGAERVAQFGVRLERQRVLAVRPVDGDRRDLAVDVPGEVFRRKRCALNDCHSAASWLFFCAAAWIDSLSRASRS